MVVSPRPHDHKRARTANGTTGFTDLLHTTAEQLVKKIHGFAGELGSPRQRIRRIAKRWGLNDAQLLCAVGFNPYIRALTDVLSTLGYASYDELARHRNHLLVNDVYRQLSIRNVLAVYGTIKEDLDSLFIMQYLLTARLANIEAQIEATVKSNLIDKYKAEIRSIYIDGIAQTDFAEARIENTPSGFRALVNEIKLIIQCKLIPVGDILFRDAVVPEEKRKIIERGLVPETLIASRLQDKNLSEKEKAMLENYLRLNG